ncbi:hypothetical protein IU486_31350 [Streptomyces gardneri]|uniref:hypothetical protein n=1 Tax=Nocardia abscessus TaxID=120957 RepID=UPI0018932BE0|nr:hypothetical protein [Nocardia abscessus]MBF6169200.1 hypothetical protein [Streptomyces gardneri]MBF6475285.1 hypothetical protein [Nocardia abscessus]
MALVVHLTPEKNARRIRRAGIAANGSGRGVFCMPVMPSYVLSHQWLRELRRGGQRLIVAVDFRIPDAEPVLVGHYGAAQTELTAAEAVSVILHAADARGYEILVPRAIAPCRTTSDPARASGNWVAVSPERPRYAGMRVSGVLGTR